jgi:hypothetical protein
MKIIAICGGLLLLIGSVSSARDQRIPSPTGILGGVPARPLPDFKVHNIGELWTIVSNFGNYGDPNSELPSYDWPGGVLNDYYLWEGRFWFGAMVNGVEKVSHADFGNYEFDPSDGSTFKTGKGTSMWDIDVEFDDFGSSNIDPLGVKVIQKAMAWSVPTYDDFIAYEYKLINVPGEGPGDLQDFYVCWVFDADVCEADVTDLHIDDLVSFDGQILGKPWQGPEFNASPSPTDDITLLPDTVLNIPDGVFDQYTIFGDEPEERVLINGQMITMGDTIYVPRNTSYIYDGDNASFPGDDEGEENTCPGYIGGRLVYAPPTSSDSTWIDAYSQPARMIRPISHQWWNWNSDPGNDIQKYQYMTATHSESKGYQYMPHPFDIGAPVFDYRFMLTTGPYDFPEGETLEFVFVGAVGQGLDGGYDDVYRNRWVTGLRHHMDRALQAYYMGSQNSDPIHPSAPSEDNHWIIPIPPETPQLRYSAGGGVVTLAWDDIAEITPDPIDGMRDFVGYRVYRSKFRVGDWVLMQGYVDSTYAAKDPGSFPKTQYRWIQGGNYPHTFVDSTVIFGIPYYYSLTAFDSGREPPPTTIVSLESGQTNYKKDDIGRQVEILVESERQNDPISEVPILDKVTVVPNPYMGSSPWERQYENRIQFRNLPGVCRIRIFTLNGDFVRELNHTSGTGDESWNLISRNDQDVVSGVYIYKIEAFNQSGDYVDSKIGKILILR